MVERFTMTSHPVEGGAMDVHPYGDYVLYSDFAVLAAENERKVECLEMIATRDKALTSTGAVKTYSIGMLHRKDEQFERAEAFLAEARKALEPFARNVELIHPGAQDHDRLCDYGSQFNGTPTVGQARAARRALTGGQEGG